jgi:hypothetical protein
MSIADKLAAVSQAETGCVVRTAAAHAAWRGFKTQLHHAATPGRVMIGGLVSGFLAGIRKTSGGPGVADRLATTVLQSIIATVGAGMTAGAAAEAAARPAASAAASAAAKATTVELERDSLNTSATHGAAQKPSSSGSSTQ